MEQGEEYAPGRIVGLFDKVIICVSPRVLFFAAGQFTRRDHPNGCLNGPFDDGIVNIDCRGVEPAGEFSMAQPHRRGF